MSKSPTQVGTNTTTTTQTQAPPPYVAEAQQNLMNAAGSLTLPFVVGGPPSYPVAGFTPDQEMAFALARNQAQEANTGNMARAGAQNMFTQAVGVTPDGVNNFTQQYMNPYTRDVVGTTTQQLTEANDKQLAAIRARQAAEGSYGGNRGALEEMEQNRNFGNTLANTTANLNQSGYNTAQALANQNITQNAGWENQSRLFNAQQVMTANQQSWQQQMQALQALLGTGEQQRTLAQQALGVPYQMLDIFRGVVPQAVGGTTSGSASQPIYGRSGLDTALGLGTMAAGIFSDRTMKTDIQKLGKDEDTGLDMYAYRYKGDPKDTPKVVGPMAQDVEKHYPGSTKRVGGKLMIKGDAARAILGF